MKNSRILCGALIALFMLSGFQLYARGRAETNQRVILSTTTSTYDSGL